MYLKEIRFLCLRRALSCTFFRKNCFVAIQIKDCIQYRKKNEISGIILSGEFLTFAKFCLRDLNSKFSSQDKVKIKNETHIVAKSIILFNFKLYDSICLFKKQ